MCEHRDVIRNLTNEEGQVSLRALLRSQFPEDVFMAPRGPRWIEETEDLLRRFCENELPTEGYFRWLGICYAASQKDDPEILIGILLKRFEGLEAVYQHLLDETWAVDASPSIAELEAKQILEQMGFGQ